MNHNLKMALVLIACLFIIPIIGVGVAIYSENSYESQFRESLINTPGGISSQEYDSRNISYMNFCESNLTGNTDPEIESICSFYQQVTYAKYAAAFALVVGLALLLLIFISKNYAGLDRSRLASVFGPTVRIVMVLLVFSVLTQAALLTYSIYTLEASFFGRVHVGLIAAFALGALIASWTLLRSAFSLIKNKPAYVRGYLLRENEQSELFQNVHQLAHKLGATPPNNIIVGLEPTFYVTASDLHVTNFSEPIKGRTLFISLPLMRLFNQNEMNAVIGHELGHFRGDDVSYSMKFAPIYTRLSNAISELSNESQSASDLSKLPAAFTLSFCLNQFASAERSIGRDRELLADQTGAIAASPEALASALIKVSLFADLWPKLIHSQIDMLADGRTYNNLSTTFYDYCQSVLDQTDWHIALDSISSVTQAHPVDTHPPLVQRIESLGLKIHNFDKESIYTKKATSIDFLHNPELIEEELTNFESRWLQLIGVVVVPNS